MQNRSAITSSIELVSALKMLVEAYEEVSVVKMQKSRSSVLSTRDFILGLSDVFGDVRYSFESEVKRLLEKEKKEAAKISFKTGLKNNKRVSVLLSANAHLYGDVVKKVYHLFMDNISQIETDIVIVGRIGKSLYDASERKKEYTYFDLPDEEVTLENLQSIVSYISKYEYVDVYYGQFVNVISQISVSSSISGEHPLDLHSEQAQKARFDSAGRAEYFDFEPSFDKIYFFFENQVFFSLFKQTVHETELARLASRINAMEGALIHIEKTERELFSQKRRLKKMTDNRKKIETLSGMRLWNSN